MVNVKYANAMSEVLYYLKGIRQEDIDKIPKKFMSFLEENASKDYVCNFDYYKPLKDLQLLDETYGIISIICLKYWCTTQEEKQEFMELLDKNEKKYQEELREKYNPDNIFKKPEVKPDEQEQAQNVAQASSSAEAIQGAKNNVGDSDFSKKILSPMIEYKESAFKKIINKIKSLISKK